MANETINFETFSGDYNYILEDESIGDLDNLQSLTQLKTVDNHLNYNSTKNYLVGDLVYSLSKYYICLINSTGKEPSANPTEFKEVLIQTVGSPIVLKEALFIVDGVIINKTSGIDTVIINESDFEINFISGNFSNSNYIVQGLNITQMTHSKPFSKITNKTVDQLAVSTTHIELPTKLACFILIMEVN